MEEKAKWNTFLKTMDSKELDFPETVFVRDIESRVLQGIIWRCLSKIKGIVPIAGNLIDSLLGRDTGERVKGIGVEQDQKGCSLLIRVEVNVAYGVAIPAKAEEIQTKIVEEISSFTGLHVASVHVIFKGLIMESSLHDPLQKSPFCSAPAGEEDYSRRF